MAKKIRFPLKMKNGAEVRTLDELKENFDLESVLGYFTDGKLATWLADRYYDEKAEAVSALSKDMPDLTAKLCEILEVEYQGDDDVADLEYIQRRNEKLRILSAYTDNNDILNNIDIVAMSQDELFDILDEQPEKVYLYGEKFSIPFGAKNVCYVGVNNPLIILETDKSIDKYEEANIKFQKVRFEGNVNPFITIGEKLYLEGKYHEAFPIIEQAANNGNPRAMYILAMSYKDGSGIECNSEKCSECLRKANGLNEPLSMMNYAYWCCESDEEEKRQILSQYSEQLKKMADSGDTLAQFEYGDYLVSYSDNEKLGIEYMSKAATKGFAPAQNNLGNKYYNGKGVEKDYAKAVEWYRKAAEQGYDWAQYNLAERYYSGDGVEQDYVKALEWYIKAAEQENTWAQNALGNMYYNGNGVEKDYSKAVEWYRKAAEQGYDRAQYNLANMYKNGNGIEQDYVKAVEWYTNAAEQGNSKAQDILGDMYYNGNGVEKDYSIAAEWYRKSAENGLSWGQNDLGNMYYNGNGVEKDYAKAVEWYRKAAEQGYAWAQNNLGWMYRNGYGVEKDYAQAVEWYRKAAEQGNADAQNRLGFMYDHGYGVSIDKNKAKEWYEKAKDNGSYKAEQNLKLLENKGIEFSDYYKLTYDAAGYNNCSWSERREAKKRLRELGPLWGVREEDWRNLIK